jgi:hypothetical protein
LRKELKNKPIPPASKPIIIISSKADIGRRLRWVWLITPTIINKMEPPASSQPMMLEELKNSIPTPIIKGINIIPEVTGKPPTENSPYPKLKLLLT